MELVDNVMKFNAYLLLGQMPEQLANQYMAYGDKRCDSYVVIPIEHAGEDLVPTCDKSPHHKGKHMNMAYMITW